MKKKVVVVVEVALLEIVNCDDDFEGEGGEPRSCSPPSE